MTATAQKVHEGIALELELWVFNIFICPGRYFHEVSRLQKKIRYGDPEAIQTAFKRGAYQCVATFNVQCATPSQAAEIVNDVSCGGTVPAQGRSWIECLPDLSPGISAVLNPQVIRQQYSPPAGAGSVIRVLHGEEYAVTLTGVMLMGKQKKRCLAEQICT